MGKNKAGSWEKRPEWVVEVMTTNPTPNERARWSMLAFAAMPDGQIRSKRANGTEVTRFMLEDAIEMLKLHYEKNVKPYLKYRHTQSTYRFRNLVSNEVVPWELLSDE